MPISELGYRHWEGKRTGLFRRAIAIAKSEVSIAYKSSKLLRRFLVFAWMPILYFCPFFLAIGYVADPKNSLDEGTILTQIALNFLPSEALGQLREHPELSLPGIWSLAFYFFFAYTGSALSMIVVAIVGPPLIAKDMRSKAFLVYFSKPIQPWQYLLGKLGTVIFFVFSMTLFPALLLYAIGIGLSPNTSTLVATLPILLKVVMSSLITAIPVAMVVLLISSFTKDRKIATFLWVAVWIFGEIAFRTLTLGGRFSEDIEPPAWASLLSIRELTTRATSGIFDVRNNIEMLLEQFSNSGGDMREMLLDLAEEVGEVTVGGSNASTDQVLDIAGGGYPPIVSIACLIGLSVACGVVIVRRAKGQVNV
ncbi:MAG: ABC-2 type transport system permease protein [Chlamydiales bacterium]|jgi:ABC-2 type transport system permease protein